MDHPRGVFAQSVVCTADDDRHDAVLPVSGRERAVAGAFDRSVQIVADWPPRTALLVGTFGAAEVVAALTRRGFAAVQAQRENALELAAQAAPFTFLLLGPDVAIDSGCGALVRALISQSPSTRVLLLGQPGDYQQANLLEVMRAGAMDMVDPFDTISLTAKLTQQLLLAGEFRERVLAIGAHPDDIEIGCGGTLLAHRRRGHRISMLTLSTGAVGGDHSARVQESIAAARMIGGQLLFGDLADTRIEVGIETIRLIESVTRVVDPTIVYVHSAHDNHQDHRAVHDATLSATRTVPQVYAYQSPSATEEFRPTKLVAIDDVIIAKVELLKLFDSQRERSYLDPELVVAAARYWARHVSPRARYAEPFEVIRELDTSDRVHGNASPAGPGANRTAAVTAPATAGEASETGPRSGPR